MTSARGQWKSSSAEKSKYIAIFAQQRGWLAFRENKINANIQV
jgi:hypothetical protein